MEPSVGAIEPTGYLSTADRDPYPFYDQIRSTEPYWDASMEGWLVTNYSDCRHVLGHEDLFERSDRYVPGGRAIRVTRAVSLLIGREHHVRHKMLVSLIGGHAAEPYRERYILPTANRLIDRLGPAGSADLVAQYANELPLRVGLASLGVDAWDEDLVGRIRSAGARMEAYRRNEFEATQATIDEAAAGRGEIDAFLRGVISERQTAPGDDVVSDVLARGRSYLPEWDDEDTLAAISAVYAGGEIRFGLRQVLASCIGDASRQAWLREDSDHVDVFVEEVLRTVGPVHWMGRIAMHDTIIGGVMIREGDRVFAMLASANRDPSVFQHPSEIGVAPEDAGRDHLAFGFGTRFCPGAALSRLEIAEALRALLARCHDLEWAAPDDPLTLQGVHVRSYNPLKVTFRPGAATPSTTEEQLQNER